MGDPDYTSTCHDRSEHRDNVTVLELPNKRLVEVTDPLVWTSPGPELWVATRSGEFAGFVERSNGLYVVTDELGRTLSPAATLQKAKSTLDFTAEALLGRVHLRVLRVSAVAVAGVAVVAFAASLAVFHL